MTTINDLLKKVTEMVEMGRGDEQCYYAIMDEKDVERWIEEYGLEDEDEGVKEKLISRTLGEVCEEDIWDCLEDEFKATAIDMGLI